MIDIIRYSGYQLILLPQRLDSNCPITPGFFLFLFQESFDRLISLELEASFTSFSNIGAFCWGGSSLTFGTLRLVSFLRCILRFVGEQITPA